MTQQPKLVPAKKPLETIPESYKTLDLRSKLKECFSFC